MKIKKKECCTCNGEMICYETASQPSLIRYECKQCGKVEDEKGRYIRAIETTCNDKYRII